MKIVVAGTVNRDVIRFPDGNIIESLGGALYSILTLAAAALQGWEILPIANVGEDIYPRLLEIMSQYSNINPEGLKKVNYPNNTVYLQLSPGQEREEHTDLKLPPIKYCQLEPHLDCNALMLNFTSGFDMEVTTAENALKERKRLAYIDLHSLTLGLDSQRRRFQRKIPDWRRWTQGADFIQLTAGEAWSLFPDNLLEPDNLPAAVGEAIGKTARVACLMTDGERGVDIFTGTGQFHREAKAVENPVDTTGCGDVFGAAFLVKYLMTSNIDAALDYGIHCAAIKCRFRGAEKLRALPSASGRSE